MPMWLAIEIPYIAERFIAFTIPDDRRFLVVSYEGVHEVALTRAVSIRSDASVPEGRGVFDGGKLTYEGATLPTLGLHGGTPLIVDKFGNTLDLKPPDPPASSNDGTVEVWGPDGELVQSLPFVDYSGDWQQASFSTDHRHILIGTPYTMTLYRRARWAAGGYCWNTSSFVGSALRTDSLRSPA